MSFRVYVELSMFNYGDYIVWHITYATTNPYPIKNSYLGIKINST